MRPRAIISTVSCAGPDDRDDPALIAALAAEWPEIEVGLQASRTREGSREYPSRKWVRAFAAACGEAPRPVRAALHVNGRWVREMCAGGRPDEVSDLLALRAGGEPLFRRVQMNFDAVRDEVSAATLDGALRRLVEEGFAPVLQAKPANDGLLDMLEVMDAPFDVLFDASGGHGVRPDRWPEGRSGRFNAWAGGLGPDTALEDLPALAEAAAQAGLPEFGIDAQRGLRTPGTGDRFEPDRAARFAAAARGWNAGRTEDAA